MIYGYLYSLDPGHPVHKFSFTGNVSELVRDFLNRRVNVNILEEISEEDVDEDTVEMIHLVWHDWYTNPDSFEWIMIDGEEYFINNYNSVQKLKQLQEA